MARPTVIDVPTEEVARLTVTPAGEVMRWGPLKLEVPAGALTSDTTVIISRLPQPFHMEPAGADDS